MDKNIETLIKTGSIENLELAYQLLLGEGYFYRKALIDIARMVFAQGTAGGGWVYRRTDMVIDDAPSALFYGIMQDLLIIKCEMKNYCPRYTIVAGDITAFNFAAKAPDFYQFIESKMPK